MSSDTISFSYEDANQVVVLPAHLEGRQVRLARIDSNVARIFCTNTIEVFRDCGRVSSAVPVHREEVFISWSEKYIVYKFEGRIALIEPEHR
jgi:hypothetical protein